MSTEDRFHTPALRKFIERLVDSERASISAHNVAIVVAHPDDETLGCGATLKRLRGAQLVVVTDGVPRRGGTAAVNSSSAHMQAIRRWRELLAALELAGHKPSAVKGLAVADQEAAQSLVAITRRLAKVFATSGTAIALTHAYEGGDSDHDATAFAVHQAAALCRQAAQDVTVLEMPSRRPPLNSLSPEEALGMITLPLTPEGRALKERMLACFESGTEVPRGIFLDAERFRLAPAYDFAEPPNGGLVSYGPDGRNAAAGQWCDLALSAKRRLVEEEARRQSR